MKYGLFQAENASKQFREQICSYYCFGFVFNKIMYKKKISSLSYLVHDSSRLPSTQSWLWPYKSRFPVPRTPDSIITICTFSALYITVMISGQSHFLCSFHFDKNKEVKYINLLSLRDQWELNLGSFYQIVHSLLL